MKKVLAVLLTAILAFTALTAAAENPSPEKLSGVIVSVSGKDADGNTLKLAVEPTKIEQSTYTDALNNLKKEWAGFETGETSPFTAEPRGEQRDETKDETAEENFAYPFGGWTDEKNYQKRS